MFIFSVRSGKFRLFVLVFVLVVLAAVCIIASNGKKKNSEPDVTVYTQAEIDYKVNSDSDIISFIEQFGWKVNPEPCEICEVIIPSEFDEVYTQYNKIQLEQGLDLTEYAGKRVKKKTYAVLNYEGYENNAECIRINLLIYNSKVIGGDVCNIELGGFMHGFNKSE